MAPQETRKVTSLLLDAAYGSEHREALRMLKDDVGHVVETDRLIHLVGKRFPEVAAHPDFERERSSCIDLVVSMLGLEPRGEGSFVSRAGVAAARGVRQAAARANPKAKRRLAVASSVARLRDESRDAAPPARPKKQPATASAARKMSWRPRWWPRLREWSAASGFRLKRLEITQGSAMEAYRDRVASLLVSDEDLALPHWRTGSFAAELTDVDRIEVHAHLVHQALKQVRVSRMQNPDVTPPAYTELVKRAFFLGIDDDVVDVALARRFQRTSTIPLRRGMRIKATVGPGQSLDEVLELHEEVTRHAKSLGMNFDNCVSRATDVVAVTRWNLRSSSVTKAIRYRVPIVLIDDFLAAGMRDTLESREIAFPAQRAAICGRCGIVHAFSARRVHRKDLICPACR